MKTKIFKWILIIVPTLIILAYFAVGAVVANTISVPKRQFASQANPGTLNLNYQDVRFPAHGESLQIAGWFIPHPTSQRAIILVHGKDASRTEEFAGRFTELAAALHQGGFNVLMIDLRGHGQSDDAHYSFGINERRDVEGAVDWLVQKGFQPGSIGVLGISLGAASSIGATADDPRIGALIEDSGFASFCPIVQAKWGSASGLPDIFIQPTLIMLRVEYGYDLCAARPVDEIGRIAPRPVLIIHSTSDELVPVSNAEQLKAAAPFAETIIVTGPEHARSFNDDPAKYSQRVIEFFDKGLVTGSAQVPANEPVR